MGWISDRMLAGPKSAYGRLMAICAIIISALAASISPLCAATVQQKYYAHEKVEDKYGVIAPWYQGLNGQCDLRVRVSAETMKRYPWTDTSRAITALPEYMFNGCWSVSSDGTITPNQDALNSSLFGFDHWNCIDLGPQSAFVLESLLDYYAYSGDPTAIAHADLQANMLIDYGETDSSYPWPNIVITNPVAGTPYGRFSSGGWTQLDFLAEIGTGLLKAYQVTGNTRWFDTAKHWGDLFAEKRGSDPNASPWNRYACIDNVPWKDDKQTGGVVFVLDFLDELIRLGYTGNNNDIVAARDAGREYFKNVLLPVWTTYDTWARNYDDNVATYQNGKVTIACVQYMMDHKDYFTNWKNDVRNMMSLYINNTCVNPDSNGDVYSGAWAYPESLGCCGRSLWYEPMYFSSVYARYAAEAGSEWSKELARRQMILSTYDIHETGISEDNIDGGAIVCSGWFKLAAPAPLQYVLATMAWMPEELGANRENHIMYTSSVIKSVVYGKGTVAYSTSDAPANTIDVLRLAYVPSSVTADGQALEPRTDLSADGYTTKALKNGDCILAVRHDGKTKIAITGPDPQSVVDDSGIACEGSWNTVSQSDAYGGTCRVASASGAVATCKFNGNQVRLIGSVATDGGLADVYVDGEKQLVGIDCWNPSARYQQVLYYKNGLTNAQHELKIVAKGESNPISSGKNIYIDAVQYSDAAGNSGFGEGGGPTDTQRMVFGYTGRENYVDSAGNIWRPGTEFAARIGPMDAVMGCWWTTPSAIITNTADSELYRYGIHGHEFMVNVTVGPGDYYVKLKFAATRIPDTRYNCITIDVNGNRKVTNFDVSATAGGVNKAVDLVFNNITPKNGVIEIKLSGGLPGIQDAQAFVQAIEVGPGNGGTGAIPVTVNESNLLANPAFDEGCPIKTGTNNLNGSGAGWAWTLTPGACLGAENTGNLEPKCIRSASGALQESADYAGGETSLAYQVVNALPSTRYRAGTFVKGVGDFGASAGDSAGLWVKELRADGSVACDHGKKMITKATANWVQKELVFTTRSDTAKIWYGLQTFIGCKRNAGHVVFDDCYLDMPSILSGKVTCEGKSLKGVAVTVGGKPTTTAADGSYKITGLVASRITIAFSEAGYRNESKTLRLSPGSNTLNIEMTHNLLANPGFEDGVTIYSGTASGSGNGWSYEMVSGDNAIRPESYYSGDIFSPGYHSGSQAIRFRTTWGGENIIYQDVAVNPNAEYTASAWVRGYSSGGAGFGHSAGDKAGIWIQELDSSGNLVRDDGEAVITQANSAYENKSMTFTTMPTTAKIRYLLHSIVAEDCRYGAVTYDDCVLCERSSSQSAESKR